MTRARSQAQGQGGLDPAVRVTEEPHVVHADALGRGDLLGPAQGGHLGPREALVEAAGVQPWVTAQ